MSAKAYHVDGEWGGWSLRPSKHGWLYSAWSAIQGNRSGQVLLYPYSTDYPRGTDLDSPINPSCATAEAIVHNYQPIRTIRRGYIVQ